MGLAALLVASSLVVPVAVGNEGTAPDRAAHLTVSQKAAAIRSLMDNATRCIAGKVSANPRFQRISTAGDVNELIVESVPSCVDAVRAMIDAHDRLFGQGTGETFFMGRYLDELPGAVNELMKEPR